MLAVLCGHIAVVKLLLKNGININVADKQGRTALIWASQMENEAMVKLLNGLQKAANRDDDEEEGSDGSWIWILLSCCAILGVSGVLVYFYWGLSEKDVEIEKMDDEKKTNEERSDKKVEDKIDLEKAEVVLEKVKDKFEDKCGERAGDSLAAF